MNQPIQIDNIPGCRLWIDGVGCWLVWFEETLTFGNAAPLANDRGRLRLMADLSSRHAAWRRQDDQGLIQAQHETFVNGQRVISDAYLHSDDEIQLGREVRLKYRVPSPLTNSAVLTVVSGHRTMDRIDGVVLFDRTCLIGVPIADVHIPCPRWENQIVLFARQGKLHWKMQRTGSQDSQSGTPSVLYDGEIFGDSEFRIRVETV